MLTRSNTISLTAELNYEEISQGLFFLVFSGIVTGIAFRSYATL